MGYPTVSQFDTQFIQRTLQNLECKVDNNYTHLMNSLLGLIILPRQWFIQGKKEPAFFSQIVLQTPELKFLKNTEIVAEEFNKELTLAKLEFKYQPIEELTIGILIERLRHCIAHQSLRPTSENNDWAGVIFRSYPTEARISEWSDKYDVQVYFTMKELKIFAMFIAENYLKE